MPEGLAMEAAPERSFEQLTSIPLAVAEDGGSPHLPSAGRRWPAQAASLRAEAPGGAYVLHGPDVTIDCSSNTQATSCSTSVEQAARLEHTEGESRRWRVPIEADEREAGALVADERGAYVATFHPTAACATVRAFTALDGRLAWERLVGCMTEAHSAYVNDVDLVLERDRLLVWGAESAGRYVVALNPRTGDSLCERRFDPK